jgi:DHA1 family inner membrane transport protein
VPSQNQDLEKAPPLPLAAIRLDSRIYALSLGMFAIGADVFVIAGVLPRIAADLGIAITTAGQIVTAYALCFALGSPLLAALSAGWRRERTVLLALLGFALADLLSALSDSLPMLLAARVLAGSAAALYAPTAYTIASALAPEERRGRALSRVMSGTTTAVVLGVPLGTWIGNSFGWRWSFVLAAMLALAGAAVLALAKLPRLALPAPRLMQRFQPLAHRPVLMILLAQLLWSSCNYSIYTYSAVLLGSRIGLQYMALLLLCAGIGTWIGAHIGGRLVDRFGDTAPTIAIAAVNVVNLALLDITGGTLAGACGAFVVFGFTGWALIPAQQARLLRLAPEHGGVVISLLSATAQTGSALGAALGGLLLAQLSPVVLPLLGSAGVALGLAIFLRSTRT